MNAQDNILDNDDGIRNSSTHLVKTVADLPVFVTIEGYHVASYKIDGEPYLCLPHLLLNIKQEFNLERVVSIFEETITNFSSATSKQVEGFVKASVLPPDAQSCPLIRRSDAERVCLRLYDQYSVNKKKIVSKAIDTTAGKSDFPIDSSEYGRSEKSKQRIDHDDNKVIKVADKVESFKSKSNLERHSKLCGISSADNVDHQQSTSSDLNDDFGSQDSSGLSEEFQENNKFAQNKALPFDKLSSEQSSQLKTEKLYKLNKQSDSSSKSADRFRAGNKYQKICSATNNSAQKDTSNLSSDGGNSPRLFESELQVDILNLARDVTSTLMIQVHHKCFGKCNGFYYPSLLNDSSSQCIECTHCHTLLSPRRFIGHVDDHHKQTNVCHWGFNSHNWRHYIRLSKKQSLNNLDEDELLMKFEQLRTIHDPIELQLAPANDCHEEIDNTTREKATTTVVTNNCTDKCRRMKPIHKDIAQHHREKLEQQAMKKSDIYPSIDYSNFEQQQQQEKQQQQHRQKDDKLKKSHHYLHGADAILCEQNIPLSAPSHHQAQSDTSSNPSKTLMGNPYIKLMNSPRQSSIFVATLNRANHNQIFAHPNLMATLSSKSLSTTNPEFPPMPLNDPISQQITHRNSTSVIPENLTPRLDYLSASSAPMLHYPYDLKFPDDQHFHQNYHRHIMCQYQFKPLIPQMNPSSSASSNRSQDDQRHQSERNLSRDLYVSTNLATYLNSKKIDPKTSEDIITCTLSLIDRSRTLL